MQAPRSRALRRAGERPASSTAGRHLSSERDAHTAEEEPSPSHLSSPAQHLPIAGPWTGQKSGWKHTRAARRRARVEQLHSGADDTRVCRPESAAEWHAQKRRAISSDCHLLPCPQCFTVLLSQCSPPQARCRSDPRASPRERAAQTRRPQTARRTHGRPPCRRRCRRRRRRRRRRYRRRRRRRRPVCAPPPVSREAPRWPPPSVPRRLAPRRAPLAARAPREVHAEGWMRQQSDWRLDRVYDTMAISGRCCRCDRPRRRAPPPRPRAPPPP